MMERLRVPEPANDNISPEQQEARKKELTPLHERLKLIRDWLQNKQTVLVSEDKSADALRRKEEIYKALQAVRTKVQVAGEILEMAQRESTSEDALAQAQAAIRDLSMVVEVAENLIEYVDDDWS